MDLEELFKEIRLISLIANLAMDNIMDSIGLLPNMVTIGNMNINMASK